MACVDEHQPSFKHYCRVCKKGFMCGRALGGHMRAHGIGDENGNLDDDDEEEEEEEDPISDWEEKSGGGKSYQLRTNPNRLKSCRTCENCGKEFLSWKSFLEHGKCSSDDESDGGPTRRWSKRKRSLRSNDEDILLARCLVQLANTAVDPPEPEESCASAEERRNPRSLCLPRAAGGKGMFECKACKKVFSSHQALGGHRASHKKVKGCFAAKQDNNSSPAVEDEGFLTSKPPHGYGQFELVGAARRKSKVHECSICHRVFTSGQALGGHKRCHWITSNSPETTTTTTTSSLPKFHFQDPANTSIVVIGHHKQATDKLDLNVPAWAPVSTDMQLQPWVPPTDQLIPSNNNGLRGGGKNETTVDSENATTVEDEADSKVIKLPKLNDLKGMDNTGSSSQWLQVGIGSTTKVFADV